MARRQSDPELEALWRQRVARWRQSGQSVRAFCAAEALGEPAFYAWRRTLAKRDGQVSPRPGARASKRAAKFVPVTVVSTMPMVEVRCPSGHVVTLPNANIETLRQLFAALTPESPC